MHDLGRDETYRTEGAVGGLSQTPTLSQSPQSTPSQSPTSETEEDAVSSNIRSSEMEADTQSDEMETDTQSDELETDARSGGSETNAQSDEDLTLTRVSPSPTSTLQVQDAMTTRTPTQTSHVVGNASDSSGMIPPSPGPTPRHHHTSLHSTTSSLPWTLGPQHRNYVHSAASYLVGAPGGPQWEKLLERYIIFESLLSARSVSEHTSIAMIIY